DPADIGGADHDLCGLVEKAHPVPQLIDVSDAIFREESRPREEQDLVRPRPNEDLIVAVGIRLAPGDEAATGGKAVVRVRVKPFDRRPVLSRDVAADVETPSQNDVDTGGVDRERTDCRRIPARLIVEPLADVSRIPGKRLEA